MTIRSSARLVLAALLATALSVPAALPAHAEKGGGKPEHAGGGKPDKGNKDNDKGNTGKGGGNAGGIGTGELLAAGATAALIQGLLGGQTQTLSVGAKPLPPGIQKNLARGKPLPPGLAKQSVPPTLLGKLPVVQGHEWTRVGTELVLIDLATQVVAQVITDVFN